MTQNALSVLGFCLFGVGVISQQAFAACDQTNPVTSGAVMDVQVTNVPGGYRYEYTIRNSNSDSGCVDGAMLDVSTRTATPESLIVLAPRVLRDPDGKGFRPIPGSYTTNQATNCSGGLGGLGRFGWDCAENLDLTTNPPTSLDGVHVAPGESRAWFSIETPDPPAARSYTLTVLWDPDAPGTTFKLSTMPLVTGTTVGPTDPSELQIYNGGGQKPNDVNLFLSYTNPLEHRNPIRAAETRFPLSLRYGATVLPPTFKATLNGTDVTASFHPAAGTAEVVTIVLQPGSNTVVLSIDGKTASGRTATDTDRLVLLVSP